MRLFVWLCGFIAVTVVVWADGSNSPVGTWQTGILGTDRGVANLTFDDQAGVSGYGITRDSLAPFTIGGTWDFDDKGDIVTAFTMFKTNGSVAVSAHMRLHGQNKLRGDGHSTGGHLVFLGAPADNVIDLSGGWFGQVKIRGTKMLDMFTVSASTNMPAWFDFSGDGLSNGGTFTVTGSLVITSDRRAAAYTLTDFGTGTQSATFAGKVVQHGRKLVFAGKTDDHSSIILHAERP
jgi:hypothetical protein